MRVLELMSWRNETSSKTPKREIRFLPALMSIHTHVWRTVFGKPADAIEKSVENPDECESGSFTMRYDKLRRTYTCEDMVIDNDPPITRHISVPRDMSQLSCSSFTAGVVEAVLDGLGFVSRPNYCYPIPEFITHAACPCHRTQYAHGGPSQSHNNTNQAGEVRARARRGVQDIDDT